MNRLIATAVVAILVVACAAPTRTPLPAVSAHPTQSLATAAPSTPTAAPSATAAPSVATTTPSSSGAASPSLPATSSPSASVGGEVVLVTHDSFAASDSVISDFETQSGAALKVLKGGDAGTMVNQAILTKSDPLGDALYGVDNTFLSRALDAGIFVPYVSPAAASIPAEFKLDPNNRVTPIDYGDVCINYDKKAFDADSVPQTIADLTKPQFDNKLVVENPATSSPGLAFVLATILRFGESSDYTWLEYWKDLRANGVLVVPDWNSAYYNEFSGGAGGGDRPLVVSYATSPAAEVYFADPQPTESPTGNVDDGCFRQIEFAAVLAGARNPAAAQAWVDYMASPEFQSDMPLNMFVFPTNPAAQVTDLFTRFPAKATNPLTMDPATIAANRDRWIQEWTDTVLH